MSRLPLHERREAILAAAMKLSRTTGYNRITREEVAAEAGVSMGLINHHFNTMTQLRRDIMRAAVRNEVMEVIVQGLSLGDDHAKKAPEELKRRATEHVLRQR